MPTTQNPDALFYGGLVQVAYLMFENKVTDTSDPVISKYWPAGWQIDTYITLKKTSNTPLYITQDELFGFIAVNAATSTAVIILRGTQTIMDWIIDVGVVPEQNHDIGGAVESGFYQAYLALTASDGQILENKIKSITQQNIVVAGHSLGASLSILAAAALSDKASPSSKVYVYAPPKTGSPRFVANFNSKIASCNSYINIHDIVPMMPPGPFYGHAGNIMNIDSSKFPAIKAGIVCWHSMLSYLYMLGSTQFSLSPECSVPVPPSSIVLSI